MSRQKGLKHRHSYMFQNFYFLSVQTVTEYYGPNISPLNAELNTIRHLLALVGARHIVHVSRIRAKAFTIYFLPFICLLNYLLILIAFSLLLLIKLQIPFRMFAIFD